MPSIEEYFREFRDEADMRAQAGGDFLNAAFFELYEAIAAENGDVESLDYAPYRRTGMQIDGYHLDPDMGLLTIAVADFRHERELAQLNATELKSFLKRAETFVERAQDANFVRQLEESSPGFQVAYLIRENLPRINRIRFLLLSNAKLASRLTGMESTKVNGRTHSYSVLDFGRYYEIQSSRTGQEPIEIDIAATNGGVGLRCLPAFSDAEDYEAFLVCMPGKLLADIYSEYGARLLEQNVRTFLQARGKVNQGMIRTIKTQPEMFFAYNNGLTATAAEIKTSKAGNGETEILTMKNLQIVNGGQTTASMTYARDKEKCDLSKVFVQMKLSVVPPEKILEVVPKISRYANTQNRVSEADFFSNHPFHVRMEEFSRRLTAPPKEGQFSPSKWFYERARGQYRDAQAYLTEGARKQFQVQFPKDQVMTKTDLAKYEVTFECRPDLVSQGAQKNFLKFAETVTSAWDKDETTFSEAYFRSIVAKAIIFKAVDQLVMKAPWYTGGYKANIVTYSIAALVNHLRTARRSELDLDQIWKLQAVPGALQTALAETAKAVKARIEQADETIQNVTEWCKKQACWQRVSQLELKIGNELDRLLVNREEVARRERDAAATQTIDNEIGVLARIVSLGAEWQTVLDFALANRCLRSERERAAISRVMKGNVPAGPQIDLLGDLLKRVEEAGYKFQTGAASRSASSRSSGEREKSAEPV